MSKKKGILFGALTWLLLVYLVEMLRPWAAKQENNFHNEVDVRHDTEILQRYLSLVSLRDGELVGGILTGRMGVPEAEGREALRRFGEACIVKADTIVYEVKGP